MTLTLDQSQIKNSTSLRLFLVRNIHFSNIICFAGASHAVRRGKCITNFVVHFYLHNNHPLQVQHSCIATGLKKHSLHPLSSCSVLSATLTAVLCVWSEENCILCGCNVVHLLQWHYSQQWLCMENTAAARTDGFISCTDIRILHKWSITTLSV